MFGETYLSKPVQFKFSYFTGRTVFRVCYNYYCERTSISTHATVIRILSPNAYRQTDIIPCLYLFRLFTIFKIYHVKYCDMEKDLKHNVWFSIL